MTRTNRHNRQNIRCDEINETLIKVSVSHPARASWCDPCLRRIDLRGDAAAAPAAAAAGTRLSEAAVVGAAATSGIGASVLLLLLLLLANGGDGLTAELWSWCAGAGCWCSG